MLPAMTPVSLNTPEFLRGKLERMIGVQVISYLFPDFSPFRYYYFKTINVSVMRTSRTKARL